MRRAVPRSFALAGLKVIIMFAKVRLRGSVFSASDLLLSPVYLSSKSYLFKVGAWAQTCDDPASAVVNVLGRITLFPRPTEPSITNTVYRS